MGRYRYSLDDAIWVKPHKNSRGKTVKGYWRIRPRVVNVKGHFRNLDFIKSYKRRRPITNNNDRLLVLIAGQSGDFEHALVNILRDVEPLVGY